jgi:(hydroxyamino)benzene mutase
MSPLAIALGKSGVLLFTLGLLIGFALGKMRNPRLGLSAHLTAVQTGAMLVALSLFWEFLGVPERWVPPVIYSVVASSYVLTVGILLSGIFGASKALPIAGAGFSASKAREFFVSALVYGSSLVMALGYLAICWFAFI